MSRLLAITMAGALLMVLTGCDRNSGGGSPGYSAPQAPAAVSLQ